MKSHNWPRVAITVLATTFLAVAQISHAQQSEADQSASTIATAEIDVEIQKINDTVAELNRLRSTMLERGEGFRQLMQRRLDDKETQATQQVISVANLLIRQSDSEPAMEQQRNQVVGWLRLMNGWLDDRLQRNSVELSGGLGNLSGLSLVDAAYTAIDVGERVEIAVAGLAASSQMLDQLAEFGTDVSNERALLVARSRDGAEMLAVAIEIDTDELRKFRYRLSLTPDDTDLQTMIKIVDLRRNDYAQSLRELSDLLQSLDVDPSQYRSQVLLVTGDVASQILDTGVMANLAKQWSKAGWDWVNKNGLGLLIQLAVFFLILLAFRALSRLTRTWVERGVQRVNLSFLLRSMIVSTAGNLVLALGLMIALSQMGVSLGPLLAGLGVLGFIVGFALQDTLGNFASGMMILLYRPYDVGDVITAGNVTGKVKDMSLVYTVIHTFDNQKMIVPNSKIWGDVIQNVTSQRVRRVDLVFGIAYSDDIEKAENVLLEIINEHEMTLEDPEPMVKVHTLNESSVDFVVRPWVKSADYWDVYWDITREVKMRFDRESISIPFPQRDVHHFYDEAPPANT
jgi:small conductance mechanosensitive channel